MTYALEVILEALYPDVVLLARATDGSAGYDARAYVRGRSIRRSDGARVWETAPSDSGEAVTIPPGEMAMVPLGFRARLPNGYEAQVRIRSSMAFKKGLIIPNSPGTIDSDFPDEWMVILRNMVVEPVTIEHGERIAQIVFARFELVSFTPGAVAISTRGGGVGSTGRF